MEIYWFLYWVLNLTPKARDLYFFPKNSFFSKTQYAGFQFFYGNTYVIFSEKSFL